MAQQVGFTEEQLQFLRDVLGEGFHTGFRKATGHPESGTIWKALAAFPDDEYRAVVDFVVDGMPAAGSPTPKPSESSMVQRIEALADALRFIRSTAAVTRRTLADACDAMVSIHRSADRALDGPPDPERDRENRADVERP